MPDRLNTSTTPVPHHVCCYGEKSDTQCREGKGEGRNGMEGVREGKGRDLCLGCCRAACVRQGQGRRGAVCVLLYVVEYYYALRHNE